MKSVLNTHWKDWCSGWNSSTLATSCKELTHWKRLWCWEGLGAGGEGDDGGWDGWMASLTRWTWVWVNSGSWCWTGRPGVLRCMGSQRVRQDWVTELNWYIFYFITEYLVCLQLYSVAGLLMSSSECPDKPLVKSKEQFFKRRKRNMEAESEVTSP